MNGLEPSMDPALRAALRERLTSEFSRSASGLALDGGAMVGLARLRSVVRHAVSAQGALQLSGGGR